MVRRMNLIDLNQWCRRDSRFWNFTMARQTEVIAKERRAWELGDPRVRSRHPCLSVPNFFRPGYHLCSIDVHSKHNDGVWPRPRCTNSDNVQSRWRAVVIHGGMTNATILTRWKDRYFELPYRSRSPGGGVLYVQYITLASRRVFFLGCSGVGTLYAIFYTLSWPDAKREDLFFVGRVAIQIRRGWAKHGSHTGLLFVDLCLVVLRANWIIS